MKIKLKTLQFSPIARIPRHRQEINKATLSEDRNVFHLFFFSFNVSIGTKLYICYSMASVKIYFSCLFSFLVLGKRVETFTSWIQTTPLNVGNWNRDWGLKSKLIQLLSVINKKKQFLVWFITSQAIFYNLKHQTICVQSQIE